MAQQQTATMYGGPTMGISAPITVGSAYMLTAVKGRENSMELTSRKRIRLKGYDYSQAGYYFITICTNNHQCLFGDIVEGVMNLNQLGQLAKQHVLEIPQHVQNVTVDSYVIMPNHVHMILVVANSERGNYTPGVPSMAATQTRSKQIIPKTVQQYKASVTRKAAQNRLWQSRYHDHVIRNERSYKKIWQYIETNPLKWAEDCYYNKR